MKEYVSILKMETVFFYQITRHLITKDDRLHCHRPPNLRPVRMDLCEAYELIILYKYMERE